MNRFERHSVLHPTQFFHGSDYEFAPGEEVVPGVELGRSANRVHVQADPERGASVYLNPVRRYAHTWGQHVYEVEPVGDVVADEAPTFLGDVRAPRARVIKKV